MSPHPRAWLAVWCLLALGSRSLLAAEISHRVGPDETLETMAKNYYGAAWKAVYIMARNSLSGGEVLTGRRLKIPGSWTYNVRRGDSPTSIAKRRLGDADRYVAVMKFNNLTDAADLAIGRELLMPFHLTHTVQPGDSFPQISRRYYRTTRHATMIRDYNKIDRLDPGQKMVVPIFDRASLDLRKRRSLTHAAQPSSTTEVTRSPDPSSSQLEARQRLATATGAYAEGGFDEACTELDNLLEELLLAGEDRIQVIKHLGFCALAYGDAAAARDYFRKWIELDPLATLDPVSTSPKILTVFYEVANEARGALQTIQVPDQKPARP